MRYVPFQSVAPAETFKGGSMGKGTNCADRHEVDICVIFYGMMPTSRDMKKYVALLYSALSSSPQFSNVQESEHSKTVGDPVSGQIEIHFRSIEVTYKGVKFDILPSPPPVDGKALQRSMWYTTLNRKTQLPYAHATASHDQVQFIGNTSAKGKDLIRMVKLWTRLPIWGWSKREKNQPSSYLLELISKKVFETLGSTKQLNDLFKTVMQQLAAPSFDINWSARFKSTWKNVAGPINGRRVLDPVNATNNVCSVVKDWSLVVSKASGLLKQQSQSQGIQKILWFCFLPTGS
ncbi:hypothetical protein SAMD00019534_073580 [Acytostelium subglobosum LB1]|uniref:hypothetical protein n=1 Tax=Acytostelium subglobosum LB1 TaxID=1410327 RepID=UPI000644A35B|nr:hypothetical protein SAMD00019534_073580 [Acytostelium subglobosum LB1]GAM24183.1 hypothetical protein SAMD00019534_073580 [Acytostelium subglobosum LB1]|eukprot:XP_012753219.1 hypothetical protein SAMD00019534_073580 [Acytostelium subglobosum LB1]